MPEFLAEAYTPRAADAPCAADLALAAEQASVPGAPVRFLGAVAAPEDETCFYLYQAPSAGAVRAALARARLRPERITPAVAIPPPRARPRPVAPDTTAGSPAPPPGTHHTSPPAPGTGRP